MKSGDQIRKQLRDWVLRNGKTGGLIDIEDDTPILESRIISSVQVMDLILFMEHLRGDPVQPNSIRPGSFTSINAIFESFFHIGEK